MNNSNDLNIVRIKNGFLLVGLCAVSLTLVGVIARDPSTATTGKVQHRVDTIHKPEVVNHHWEDHPTVSLINDIPVVGIDDQSATVSYEVENPKGHVLIVRGILTVFSLGLDQLGKRLQKIGYEVHVSTAIKSKSTATRIRQKISQSGSTQPLMIIGHSLGADLAPKLAAVFEQQDIDVDLMIMLDSTMPSSPPRNVKKCINLYQTASAAKIFQGKRTSAKSPDTRMINVNIESLADRKTTSGINHFNIDANPWIQDVVVQAVQTGNIAAGPRVQTRQRTSIANGIEFNLKD